MVRKEMLVLGRVQNVGFRFFCNYTANNIGTLTGYAKNLDNGDVLVQVQGDSDKINKFKSKLYEGNGFCKVIDILEKDIPIDINETRFLMY